jgi:sortase A
MHAIAIHHDYRHPEFLGVECAWPAAAGADTGRARRPAPWRRLVLAAAALALVGGLWQIGQAGYIHAKAWLAQALIEQAWRDTLAGRGAVPPWPWADTWPVARLTAPARGIERYVLAGANGRTIAFGPGHVFGTPLPGAPGNSVIGAHRNTHFAFLQWLERGEELEIETAQGMNLRYRVADIRVVDKRDLTVLAASPDGRRLTLVTCYPFDALRAGGPLRYVVTAEAVGAPPAHDAHGV